MVTSAEAVATVLRNLTGSDNFNISLTAYTQPDHPPRHYTSYTQASKEMGDARYGNEGLLHTHLAGVPAALTSVEARGLHWAAVWP